MVFSSHVFLNLFLPLLLLLYFCSPRKAKNVLLLAGSLFFYAWGEPSLVVVMLCSTGMNYLFGRLVQQFRGEPRGRWIVALAVAANLGFLVYFKYAVFLIDSINGLLASVGSWQLTQIEVALPIGISFYTFQAMSYVVDVYRGDVDADDSFINVALYIALFPQLIAGPIVRYRDVAEQIQTRNEHVGMVASGVQRFIVGLGKKMLIANSAATVADAVFDIPNAQLSAPVAWLGIVCYSLQIYFDFSGYSDMAIGLGRMFGFRFLENFNYPYIAASVTEFWRRWHISLSTWFRDYLYIPLGGNRHGSWKTCRNLMIVFLLCGLWHGASWTFVAWGVYHGGFLMLERQGLGKFLDRCWRPLRHAYLLIAVTGGWVFFRADSLSHALVYLKTLAGLGASANAEFHVGLYLDTGLWLVLIAGAVGSLPFIPWLNDRLDQISEKLNRGAAGLVANGKATVRVALLSLVLLASSAAMAAGTHNPFIYFRF